MNRRCLLPLVLLALILRTAPSRTDAQWLESNGAHYSVFYQAGYEKDVEFTRKWLDATEQLMRTKYGVVPDRYKMSVYLLPAPGDGIAPHQRALKAYFDSRK